jgi:phosphoenolpyruvate---glycerone phosphotransferase subunit DhaK
LAVSEIAEAKVVVTHDEGLHARPSVKFTKLAKRFPARAIAGDLGEVAKGRALLFVNGFVGTPSMERYLMYNAARKIFEKRGVTVARSLVGSYVTSLDMAGCSVTLTMLDEGVGSILGCAGPHSRPALGDVILAAVAPQVFP